ncbi:MAG: phenylalanine--tRNA ligase subunit beta, partial [Planctomycetaceae bacterium]|nr:phenylalanine--tRNA ligase subunit beta [Planctomycetaceae bacterium]
MIVSRNWLADYVALPQDTAEWADRLTMSGLNLEEFHAVGDDGDLAVDLEVTSNRADCLGHIGIAREVSVLYATPLLVPDPQPAEITESADSVVGVEIQCPDLCHEYHARVIRGVRIGPSPKWLKDRLEAIGVNSVNNVVDVTNYVMFECGQPLHAFDLKTLVGNRIIVRRAIADETITAIDQRQYRLSADTCVIADEQRPVAVAGVMGGLETEISDGTTDVLIETASFSSLAVRATARALKLHSPSSYRFERRVDRHQLDWASRRCCELILKVAGGQLLSGSVVANPDPAEAGAVVELRFSSIPRLLGIEIDPDRCVHILEQLGLQCLDRTKSTATFSCPSWRRDLSRECDLIEEVARIHGYDQIPDDAAMPIVATSRTRRERVADAVRSHLTACGYFEALTLSFVSEEQAMLFRVRGEIPFLTVGHSTQTQTNHLRQSLIPSLLQCRRQNERHGTARAELFELAKVYLSAGQGLAENEAEPTMVGMVSGQPFLQVKGCLEQLVATIAPSQTLTTEPATHAEFRQDRGARLLLGDRCLGWIGELASSVTEALDLQDDVTVGEIDFQVLMDAFEPHRHATPLPRFPSVSRDLNLVLPESVAWAQILTVVR